MKWKSIVTDRKNRAAFHHILNGLSDILKSHNYGGYNEGYLTSDGLTKTFIGLDGMLADQASRRGNTKAFVDFWHPIFFQVVSNISKRKTKRIYALRCALLHGDYDDFLHKCSDVYKVICPKSPEQNVNMQHFAFNFASFIVRTIQVIENNPAVLQGAVREKSRIARAWDWLKSLPKF